MALPEFGLSEMLNKLITGRDATTRHDDLLYSNVNHDSSMNNMANWPQGNKQDEPRIPYRTDGSSNPAPTNNLQTVVNNASKKAASPSFSSDAQKKADQEAKFKKNLGKAYGGLGTSLSKLAGFIPEEQNRLTSGIDELFTNYKDTTEKDTSSQLGELGKYRADTNEDQRKNLHTLAENTRKSFISGNTVLGAKGASDSSATGMYAKALTEEANKSRGDILDQAKKIFTEIDGKEKAVHETHDLQLANMDRWVNDQKQKIKDDFKVQRESILNEIDSADDNKRADLESLDQQNLNRAYQKLSQLEDRAYSYRTALSQWREDVLGQINTMKKSIIDRGSFTPEELQMDKPNTALQFDESQTAEDFYDPTAPKRKKSVRDLLDNPLTEDDLSFE